MNVWVGTTRVVRKCMHLKYCSSPFVLIPLKQPYGDKKKSPERKNRAPHTLIEKIQFSTSCPPEATDISECIFMI